MTASSFTLLSIDPGTIKCGLAVLDSSGKVLFREICPTLELKIRLPHLIEQFDTSQIVYGQSTGAKLIQTMLDDIRRSHKSTFAIDSIDERNSTLEARTLYWQEYPRRGLMRLIPLSLLAPPEAIDDFAAIILAQRFLKL